MASEKVRLIDCGGTISAAADAAGVLGASSHAAGLAALLPEAWRSSVQSVVAYAGLSEAMNLAHADAIMRAIADAQADARVAGIVVAHGTDMMEEVAFLSALMPSGSKPVVFTGAQRAPADAGFDGITNLTHAVQVAQAPQARGLGTVVVFAGRVLDAQQARKLDSAAPDAFGPPQARLGQVDDRGLRLFAQPVRRPALPQTLPDNNVAVVPVGLASPTEVVGLLARPPIRGLVVEAPGRGNAPPAIVEAVGRAVQDGLVVLLASSCVSGGVAPVYTSGAELIAAGVIAAGDLDARKARLLLSVALGGGRDTAAARAMISAYLAGV